MKDPHEEHPMHHERFDRWEGKNVRNHLGHGCGKVIGYALEPPAEDPCNRVYYGNHAGPFYRVSGIDMPGDGKPGHAGWWPSTLLRKA